LVVKADKGTAIRLKRSLWVTRERPKIDRIACPWLVLRFIDPTARFLYVRADRVLAVAAERDAVPFDVPQVELGRYGEQCTFDAFLAKYQLHDRALHQLAIIVRGAVTLNAPLAPESAGLYALSRGLAELFPKDKEMLQQALTIYDALYAWCDKVRALRFRSRRVAQQGNARLKRR
jgi:hypothetical protein